MEGQPPTETDTTMSVIDVTDRLTPGAKALVKMRTANLVKAANARRVHYNDVAAFFGGAWHGRATADLMRATPPPAPSPLPIYVDAWSGNPDTDRAWAHDIGFIR